MTAVRGMRDAVGRIGSPPDPGTSLGPRKEEEIERPCNPTLPRGSTWGQGHVCALGRFHARAAGEKMYCHEIEEGSAQPRSVRCENGQRGGLRALLSQ